MKMSGGNGYVKRSSPHGSKSPVVAKADSSSSFIPPVCLAVDDPSWYRAPRQSRCDRSGGPMMAVFEVPKYAELPPESLKMLVAFAAYWNMNIVFSQAALAGLAEE